MSTSVWWKCRIAGSNELFWQWFVLLTISRGLKITKWWDNKDDKHNKHIIITIGSTELNNSDKNHAGLRDVNYSGQGLQERSCENWKYIKHKQSQSKCWPRLEEKKEVVAKWRVWRILKLWETTNKGCSHRHLHLHDFWPTQHSLLFPSPSDGGVFLKTFFREYEGKK